MFCTKCGKKAEEGTKFCVECGTALEIRDPVEETPVVPFEEPAPIGAAPQPAEPVTPPTPPVTPVAPRTPPVPPVAPAPQPVVAQPEKNTTVSTATFFWMDLVLAIPLVGLIVCIVLACGATSKKSLQNWAKAKLIWALVGVIIFLLVVILAVSLLPQLYALLGRYIAYGYGW